MWSFCQTNIKGKKVGALLKIPKNLKIKSDCNTDFNSKPAVVPRMLKTHTKWNTQVQEIDILLSCP